MDKSRVRREMIAPGRILGGGKRAAPTIADYVLVYRNQKLAVIEAKPEVEEGGELCSCVCAAERA